MIRYLKKHVSTIVLIFIALLFIWPMLWIVSASFDAQATLAVRLPKDFTWDSYKAVLSEPANFRSFLNSSIISFTQATLVVILSMFAAYPLSRFKIKRKDRIMYSLLFITGLPITAIMVPVYMMFFNLKIVNSLISTSLFLTAAVLPYSIWIMKNFMDDVPISLEEAAWIDGANFLQTLKTIIVPVILPGMCVVFIMAFSGSWGNFFVPFILLNSVEKAPAAVAIYQFFGMWGRVAYGQLAAFSLLYTMPIVILYFVSQRFMSRGFIFSGAVK